jgi:excisionase family DNA binding protein
MRNAVFVKLQWCSPDLTSIRNYFIMPVMPIRTESGHQAYLPGDRLMFSKEEAARLWNVSIHTVSRDCRSGKIRCKRYGRRILISKDEILRIADEGMEITEARRP